MPPAVRVNTDLISNWMSSKLMKATNIPKIHKFTMKPSTLYEHLFIKKSFTGPDKVKLFFDL